MKYGFLENVDGVDFSLPEEHSFTTQLLKGLNPVKQPKIYIGCPVWGDKGYVGTMYPKGTKPKDFLKAYGSQFNSIEVNATRYGVPPISSLEKWRDEVPDDFVFSFKMPQVITHRKSIVEKDALQRFDQFLLALDTMGSKAGTTFMLMPSYFNLSKWNELKTFLDYVPQGFPLAIEIRDAAFYNNEDFISMLHEKDVATVITDTPGDRPIVHQLLTNNTLFVRFVGADLHLSDYIRIDAWVPKIVDWVNRGVENVYFFMHQPAPNKFKSGPIAADMINKLNKKLKNIQLKAPIDYSIEEQQSLF